MDINLLLVLRARFFINLQPEGAWDHFRSNQLIWLVWNESGNRKKILSAHLSFSKLRQADVSTGNRKNRGHRTLVVIAEAETPSLQ